MATILRLCSRANAIRCGIRAIVPSSRITSQITAVGARPASLARSTEASVCPARASTPPPRARSGNMWPGWVRSSGREVGSVSTATVRARSAAEMPVVTPCAASTLTVNAVLSGAVLFAVIGGSPSASRRSPVIAMQIRPRACVARKLIASASTTSAG